MYIYIWLQLVNFHLHAYDARVVTVFKWYFINEAAGIHIIQSMLYVLWRHEWVFCRGRNVIY